MKITKSRSTVGLGRPGGMRRGTGGRFEGGLQICRLDSEDVDFGCGFDTPAFAIRQVRRIVPRISPGRVAGNGHWGVRDRQRLMGSEH